MTHEECDLLRAAVEGVVDADSRSGRAAGDKRRESQHHVPYDASQFPGCLQPLCKRLAGLLPPEHVGDR